MYIFVSAAVSLDGYLDDSSSQRLMLSSKEDWEEVRRIRAGFDAVMVGAQTVRCDNPALVTRCEMLREKRAERGQGPDPIKVTVSQLGDIDPTSRFFTQGTGLKVVILSSEAPLDRQECLRQVARVIVAPQGIITTRTIIQLLEKENIRSLFLEGGSSLLTQFLQADAVDVMRLAVAPFFVGDPAGTRLVQSGEFPYAGDRRMHLLSTAAAGDMSILTYALHADSADYALLEEAIALSTLCPRSQDAYSVGAVIITAQGEKFTGYSRETAPDNHAEEEAIAKALRAGSSLKGATLYCSMEPCSMRKSKPLSCSALIIRNGFQRVLFTTYEPPHFVACQGERWLRDEGIEVVVAQNLSEQAERVNQHIR